MAVFHLRDRENVPAPLAVSANAPKRGEWPGWKVYPTLVGVVTNGSSRVPFFVEVAHPSQVPEAQENLLMERRGATSVEVFLHPYLISRGIREEMGLPMEFFGHELLPQLPTDCSKFTFEDRSNESPRPDCLAPLSVAGSNALRLANTWGLLHAPVLSSWESILMMRSRVRDEGVSALVSKLAKRPRTLSSLVRTYEQQAWSFVGSDNWGSFQDRDMWPSIGRAVGASEYVRQEIEAFGDLFSWAGAAVSVEEAERSYELALEVTGFFAIVDGNSSDSELILRLRGLYERLTSGERSVGASPLMQRLGRALYSEDRTALTQSSCVLATMINDLAEDLQRYLNECLWPLRGADPLDVLCCDRGSGEASDIPEGSFGLSEAMFIQFYNELSDGNGWQQCQYCGRWFKYQRTNSKPVYLTTNKRSGTQFCSKSHAVLDSRRRKEERNDA